MKIPTYKPVESYSATLKDLNRRSNGAKELSPLSHRIFIRGSDWVPPRKWNVVVREVHDRSKKPFLLPEAVLKLAPKEEQKE